MNREAFRVAFFFLMFYWNVNALVLLSCLWGPGLYWQGQGPMWASQAAEATLVVTGITKILLSICVGVSYYQGFIER